MSSRRGYNVSGVAGGRTVIAMCHLDALRKTRGSVSARHTTHSRPSIQRVSGGLPAEVLVTVQVPTTAHVRDLEDVGAIWDHSGWQIRATWISIRCRRCGAFCKSHSERASIRSRCVVLRLSDVLLERVR